jgi:hypothetical protein
MVFSRGRLLQLCAGCEGTREPFVQGAVIPKCPLVRIEIVAWGALVPKCLIWRKESVGIGDSEFGQCFSLETIFGPLPTVITVKGPINLY